MSFISQSIKTDTASYMCDKSRANPGIRGADYVTVSYC